MPADGFVTVAVFTWAHEMAVVRARLEWEGIPCFAKDENTVAAHPLYSNLIGGIKLQVPAEEAERAREILIEAGTIDASPAETTNGRDILSSAVESFQWPSVAPHVLRRIGLALALLAIIAAILLA